MTSSIRSEAPIFIPNSNPFVYRPPFTLIGFPEPPHLAVTKKLENIEFTEPKEPSPPLTKNGKLIASLNELVTSGDMQLKYKKINIVQEKFRMLISKKIDIDLKTEEDNLMISFFSQFYALTQREIPDLTAMDLAKTVIKIINEVYEKISEPKEMFPNFVILTKTTVLPLFLSMFVRSGSKETIKYIKFEE